MVRIAFVFFHKDFYETRFCQEFSEIISMKRSPGYKQYIPYMYIISRLR